MTSLLVVCDVVDESHHYFFEDTEDGMTQAKAKFVERVEWWADETIQGGDGGQGATTGWLYICRVKPGDDLLGVKTIVRARDFPQYEEWRERAERLNPTKKRKTNKSRG